MGLIDSVNKQNQLFVEVIEEEKSERLENKNKQIRKNNYKMDLQQCFFNTFNQQQNAEYTKAYFELLENRLATIRGISKNKKDEFAERELNLLYNKELNFIYNIFKKDEEAQENTIENQIFSGIQQTYKKHGIDAFYKLLDVQDDFLTKYNINSSKYHTYYNKTNKYFYNIYKTIYKNELEEKKQNNGFLYLGAVIVGGLIGASSGIKKIKNKKSQWRF